VLAVGIPGHVVGFGADVRELARLTHRSGRCIEGGQEDLLRTVARRQKRDLFAIRRKAAAAFSSGRGGERSFLSSGAWDDPEVRRLRVLREVYIRDGEQHPPAIARDVYVHEAAHFLQVLEGHGTLRGVVDAGGGKRPV